MGINMQQNLERNHAMTFRVTEEERNLIRCKLQQAGMRNMRAYLLKMAVDGRIINIELDGVKEMNRLLSNAINIINQIAKRANETGSVYSPDLEDIKARQEEIWVQQKEILQRLNNIMDAVQTKTR